jgi:prephenate dehydrogenase
MSTRIAIIGLHQIGLSVGLALNEFKERLTVVGFDPEGAQNEKVAKLAIFSKIELDGESLLKDTDLVILALPADEVHDMLASVAKWIKPGAFVLDTSLLINGMDEFAAVTLPQGNHFVNAIPILNMASLEKTTTELDEPSADLFKNGALLICSGPKTHSDAIKTAADLAELLGAHAYFSDLDEAAAILASVELLPKLVATALINTAIGSSIITDSNRLAGKAFLNSTGAVEYLDEINEFGKTALQGREHTLNSLDRIIESLMQIRQAVEENDALALKEYLSRAQTNRKNWLVFKQTLDWSTPDGQPQLKKREVVGHIPWFGKIGKSK